MTKLLSLLIYKLNTVNGERDSAKHLKETLIDIKYRSKDVKEKVDHLMMKQTLLKYKIMRIRAKISFAALKKRMTIKELILTQILDTYHQLRGDPNGVIQ